MSENALLSGPLDIHEELEICGKAEIRSPRHISAQSNPGHEIGLLAFFREANGKIGVACKRFCGFHGIIQAFQGFLSETDNGEPGFKGCEVKTCTLEIEFAKRWIDLSREY